MYFRFPDGSVESHEPDEVEGDLSNDLEAAYLMVSRTFLDRLLSSPDDLRVRFAGSDGNADFTVEHAVILELARGFGRTCP